MPERKQKKDASSLRVPQPKKLGLSVPPLLRLPHEELIRHESSSTLADGSDADTARLENAASLANLDKSKGASLAGIDALARQTTSLANPCRQSNVAALPERPTSASLMDSLPDTAGFTKLHHQVVDHLYYQLSPKEQVVHLQLYRLSWGRGRASCFISLPKLARRSNLSPRSAADAVSSLESKGLIRKGAVITGKGKEQGIEYWVTPAPALAKAASPAISASHARDARHAKSVNSMEYKEEATHEDLTQRQARVGVASRFALEECRRYAAHLQRVGQGINNPGGFATAIHRTGEADTLIELFLNSQGPRSDISLCPDCKGQGFKLVQKEGREGVVKCSHARLNQHR